MLVVVALLGYGLLVVWSAIQTNENYSFSRQLMGVAMGVVAMLIFYSFDYRRLANYTTLLLIVNVVLILSPHLPVIGVESKGAQSWVKIGIQLQPGEFAKITVILLDAAVMSKFGGRLDDPREFIRALAYIAIPFLCIMTQPDLGTGLVYLVIGAVALIMGGARWKYLIVLLGVFVGLIVAVFAIDEVLKNATGDYVLLKQYQRNRLLVFLDPSADVTGTGFNLNQAMIAIGSGGLFGKACSMVRSRAWASFRNRRLTSFSACLPSSSALWAPWCFSRCIWRSFWCRFASRASRTICSGRSS